MTVSLTLVLAAAGLPAAAAQQDPTRCSSSAASDWNGDGRSDAAIGVPGKHAKAGQVDLFDGTSTGIRPTGTALQQGLGGVPGVQAAGNGFGYSVADGDVDGNGCSDVAILALGDTAEPHADSTAVHRGSITVLYGARSAGLTTRGAQLLTERSLGIEHPAFGLGGDPVERTLQTISDPVFGDFAGDGYDDLALLDSVYDEDADTAQRSIVVVPGTATGLDLAGRVVMGVPGPHVDGHLDAGSVVLAAGDLRGGRYTDLVVAEGGDGARPADGDALHGSPTHPVLHVVFGSAAGLGKGAVNRVIDQETPGVPGSDDTHGSSTEVAVTTGDFNGDGRDDIAWGQPDLNRVSVVSGSTRGVSSTGGRTFTYGEGGVQGRPTTQQGEFGTTLAAGDFDGDGDADLVIGSTVDHISVLAGTHAHGLTARGDLLWSPTSSGIPGTLDEDAGFGSLLQTGSYGRGPGEDLLVSAPNALGGALVELFGSRTRDVGLVKTHATRIDEATAGVPGDRITGDLFGGDPY